MFRQFFFALIPCVICVFANTTLAQVQLLAPIERSLDLDHQFFPYVDLLRKECEKSPDKEFCGRVESYDAVEALRAEHCSTDGKQDSRCQEWLVLEQCKADKGKRKKKVKGKEKGPNCAKLLASRKIQEARFTRRCLKKLDEPYCEGIAHLKAAKKEKRDKKRNKRK